MSDPLIIHEARPTQVRFTLGDVYPVSLARYGQVRDAKARLARRACVPLAGFYLDESHVDALMAAMRQAQTVPTDICDDCGIGTDGTALCEPCAQRRYDDRLEKLTDRAREWTR